MEEEGSLSEKTISDEELDLDQPIEPEEEWEDIRPEESVSQVVNNTNSEVDAGSETSTFSTSNFKGSSV